MTAVDVKAYFKKISELINENEPFLTQLDQQNGDGDLGISMKNGFAAVSAVLNASNEVDLGKVLLSAANTFNENSPSSLGTILSFGMMGMAKALKGQTEADEAQLAQAMDNGLELIMKRAGSKPGEKTVLDALYPAVEALKSGGKNAREKAAEAAAAGSESTKNMVACHGRAAYYAEKSLGVLDGGSVVGKLIFRALAD